jgi:putative ABC transport system ATP-binding protein
VRFAWGRSRCAWNDASIEPSESLFVFDHVTVAEGDRLRLDDACGAVSGAGVTAVVGPSGSGKSTLLRCCNRLEVPTGGRVFFRGEDVGGLDPLVLRRRVGMVFQRPTPFPSSVRENLQVAEPSITDAAAVAALEQVGLNAGFLDRLATELSGGEAQRVCLARTLVTVPEVVLMDEVTSSVDPVQRRGLEDLARDLSSSGVSVLWVTHDLAQMRRIADDVVVVIAGRISHASSLADLDATASASVRSFIAGETV